MPSSSKYKKKSQVEVSQKARVESNSDSASDSEMRYMNI